MPRRRLRAEEIIQKISEADVLLPQGKSISVACRQLGATDNTDDRWRRYSERSGDAFEKA